MPVGDLGKIDLLVIGGRDSERREGAVNIAEVFDFGANFHALQIDLLGKADFFVKILRRFAHDKSREHLVTDDVDNLERTDIV